MQRRRTAFDQDQTISRTRQAATLWVAVRANKNTTSRGLLGRGQDNQEHGNPRPRGSRSGQSRTRQAAALWVVVRAITITITIRGLKNKVNGLSTRRRFSAAGVPRSVCIDVKLRPEVTRFRQRCLRRGGWCYTL